MLRLRLLGLLGVATLVAGFRCPGGTPTLGESQPSTGGGGDASTASVGSVGGAGGTLSVACADSPLAIVSEPQDVLRGDAVVFEVELDPLADAHEIAVVDTGDGSVVVSEELTTTSFTFLPPADGTYQAEVFALRDDCPELVALSRPFSACATMWAQTSTLPLPRPGLPAVVAGGKVVSPAANGPAAALMTADILPDGSLDPWQGVPLSEVAGLAPVTVPGVAAATVATSAGDEVWFLGGRTSNEDTAAARFIRTTGPQSLAVPPVNTFGAPPMPFAHSFGASAVLGPDLLYVGGQSGIDKVSEDVWALHVGGNNQPTWRAAGLLSHPRARCAAVSFDGSLYVVGGTDGAQTRATVERAVLDPNALPGEATLVWSAGETSLPFPRADVALAVDPDFRRLFAVGGVGANGNVVAAVYVGVIDAGGTVVSWGEIESVPAPMSRASALWTNGYLHVITAGLTGDAVTYSLALKGPEGSPSCPSP